MIRIMVLEHQIRLLGMALASLPTHDNTVVVGTERTTYPDLIETIRLHDEAMITPTIAYDERRRRSKGERKRGRKDRWT